VTRFTFVDREKALYPVAVLCRLLKVSRAGYYAWSSRPPSAREVADGVLTTQIQDAFDSNRKVYGSPRIHAELADADVHVGRKRVARLMREAGIVGCHRRRHKLGATRQNPNAAAAPDLVDRQFAATAPNQLWVADVT
jgi:putative transposase